MTGPGPVRRLPVGLALAMTVLVVGSLVLSRATDLRTEAGPRAIDKVVVFSIPGLSLDDLGTPLMPTLNRLAGDGSIAVANVRIQNDKPDLVGAYGSLGAGNRTRAGGGDVIAVRSDEPLGGTTVARAVEARTGLRVRGRIVLPFMDATSRQVMPDGGSKPGALGDALEAAGRRTAVVSDASTTLASDRTGRSAPAALAVSSSSGSVDAGSVDASLLHGVPGPGGAIRVEADPAAYTRAVARALDQADVVVVDPGDTTRALAAAAVSEGEPAPGGPAPDEAVAPPDDQLRIDALGRTDRILGRIRRELGSNTLLIVVGVTPPGSSWALTPVVAAGPRVPAGYLDSASTHRPALVTLTDLAPTILDTLHEAIPSEMIGTPLRYRPADASWDEARRLDDLLESQASVNRAMTLTFILVQSAVYGSAFLFLIGPGVPRRLRRPIELLALTCGAWPVATFLLRLGTSLYSLGPGTFALSWLIAVALALAAQRLRAHPLDPILAICSLTVATLALDLATGSHLQVGSFFGYTPHTAPRFIGLGNSAFGILAGATVVVISAIVARSRQREAAWWVAAFVALLVVVVVGAPWMGADVGGILAIVPVLALTLWALRGRRIRWQSIVVAAGLAAVVLGLSVGVEALRSPDQRTHIGRFFLNSGENGGIGSTLRRKWDANTRAIEQSPWSLLAPFFTGFGLYASRFLRPVQRVLPARSPQRIGVVATLAIGTAGWLVNDSGLVVLALACIQLGPFILLLVFRGDPASPHQGPALSPGGAHAVAPSGDGHRPPGQPVADEPVPEDAEPLEPVPVAVARVVALVPAKDRADSVADTVRSLRALARVDRVLVVDDGSTDATSARASAAGADVLRLPRNGGKGAAVLAGVAHTPGAEVYLLIDADLAGTAAAADALLDPVLDGSADLTVGVLPPAGGRGGFGTVRTLAARGIRRATGLGVHAPLSGQRAVRAPFLRGLSSAERFGLEVAMTIDVARAGGRVLEVPVPMDHRHTGRSLGGFSHRARQGADILVALWPRLVPRPVRFGLLAAGVALWSLGSYLSASAALPDGHRATRRADTVVLFAIPELGLADVTAERMPNLHRLSVEGAYGMATPRTAGRRSSPSGYATIGAGDRVEADLEASVAARADVTFDGAAAWEVLVRRSGPGARRVEGEVVVPGMPTLVGATAGSVSSPPGALGDALHGAGRTTAVVTNASTTLDADPGAVPASAPAALSVVDRRGSIDHGDVGRHLLRANPLRPFGIEADPDAFAAAVEDAVATSDVVVVDPGETARVDQYRAAVAPEVAEAMRTDALAHTDAVLGLVARGLPPGARLLVVGVTPPPGGQLVPVVVHGAGVSRHRLTSPSTRRPDLMTLTDLAPSVLGALGVREPPAMIGREVHYLSGRPDRTDLGRQEDLVKARDRVYGSLVDTFVLVAAVLYAVAAIVLLVPGAGRMPGGLLRWAALTTMAWPLATFVVRGLGPWYDLGAVTHALVWIIAALVAAAASRWRTHPLDPLLAISALTVAVLSVDLATGAHLQISSYLGYTPTVAARFVGIGNAAFGVYAAAAVITCVLLVARSSRPADAWWAAAAVALVVVVVDGAPWLGSDVGGILSLVPAFGLVLLLLAGRRPTWRTILVLVAATATLLAVAVGVEALRPVDQRTHIGRFFLGTDQAGFWRTIGRKWDLNVTLLTSSTWSWLIVIIGGFLLAGRGWWNRARPGAPERVGIVGLVAVAVLGWATNDSGTLVASLALCLLGPYLILLAQSDLGRTPEFRPAPEVRPARAEDAAVAR